MIVIQHDDGLLLDLLAHFVYKNVHELIDPGREILGFRNEPQRHLSEIRVKRAYPIDHVSKEHSKIDIGWVNLIPDVGKTGCANELGYQRCLSAAGVGINDRCRLVQEAADAIDKPRP